MVALECGFSSAFLCDITHDRRCPSAANAQKIFESILMPLEDRRDCVRQWRNTDEWERVANGTWRPPSR